MVYSEGGFDRAPLITALALVLLDPYYRTMEGLKVLIEREFVSFGHQFKTRFSNSQKEQKNILNEKTYIPIFFMFLDCIYQTMVQAPLAFEFNVKFLKKIAVHTLTLKFGTFLCDNEREREVFNLRNNTISLWDYMERHNKRPKYLNILYDKERTKRCLVIDPLVVRSSVWVSFYARWVASENFAKEYPHEL